MCGLFAVIGSGVNKDDLEFIKELAYVSGLRGLDGTGVVQGRAYEHHRSHEVFKQDVEVGYFMYHQNQLHRRKVMDNLADNFMLGHVRATTVGASNLENTHPFEFKNLIGMHNGTLTNDEFTEPAKAAGSTDSEVMFSKMNDEGILPVLKRVNDNNTTSAYAIMVYDKNTGKIIIARNSKRPLHYAFNTKRRVMYIASEAGMLAWLLGRNGIETTKVTSFAVETLYEIAPHTVEANGGLTMKVTSMFPLANIATTYTPTPIKSHGQVLEERLKAIEETRKRAEEFVEQANKEAEEVGSPAKGIRPNAPLEQTSEGLKINGKAIRKMKLPPLSNCTMCGNTLDDYSMRNAQIVDNNIFCETCEEKLQKLNGTN